jgi:hypothetical protein
VLEDFGLIGRCWRETDADNAGRETLIRDLADGQYKHLVRIVAFNAAEAWCRDVTTEIAAIFRTPSRPALMVAADPNLSGKIAPVQRARDQEN